MATSENLIERIETLKNLLVTRATGGEADNETYRSLRTELVADARLKPHLPRFLFTCRETGEFWGFIKQKFAHYQERRDYLQGQFDPVLTLLEAGDSPIDSAASATLARFDADHVKADWQKALDRKNTDTDGAITAARALLESVCKHILDDCGDVYDDGADLPKLYRLVAERLNLSPSQHTHEIYKRILGGCTSVVEGLGALRNKEGDAHGKGKAAVKPAARHADLAVNLAGTMATFLTQTWEVRKK